MDIDLLSRMVKELILENDRVTLPGVGAFVAEMVPASFSDRGYTINPPYRRLAFRQGAAYETDSLLVDMYASANKIDREAADKVLRGFLDGMIQELKQRKVLIFTGLGRLRATRENNFFFVCDEELDIFPEGVGLEPVSLKSHSKPVSFDFSEMEEAIAPAPVVKVPAAKQPAVENHAITEAEQQAVETPAADSASEASADNSNAAAEAEPQAVEAPVAEPASEALAGNSNVSADISNDAAEGRRWWLGECEPDESGRESIWKKKWFIAIFVLLCIILLAAVAFGIFLLLAKYSPELVDRLLYTKEELDILNYRL